jgi:hypothetical protein
MTKKTTVVSIFTQDWERLKKIKAKYGFPNYAETVGYVLQKFPEMISGDNIVPKKLSQIIDAEKMQLAPTKNNQFVQLGEVKP